MLKEEIPKQNHEMVVHYKYIVQIMVYFCNITHVTFFIISSATSL